MDKSHSLVLSEQLRRKGDFKEALKIVTPLVYSDGKLRPQPGGVAEYALNLAQLGAPESAESLILSQKISSQEELFSLAICQILQWKHREAAVHLELYCENANPLQYQHCVAVVNLMWCYIYSGDFGKIEKAVAKYASTILQYDVLKINFETIVRKSNFICRLQTGCDLGLKMEKFPAVAVSPYDLLALELSDCLAQSIDGKQELSAFINLEKRGNDLGLYEFARECFLWRICLNPEPNEHEVFFASGWGTPFPGFIDFAKKVTQALNCTNHAIANEAFIQENYFQSRVPDARFLDPWGLQSNLFTSSEQALLRVLVKDRYRPSTLVRLFMETREDSQYFPKSAPQVVHMMISRLRKKFISLQLDWQIESSGTYQLLVGKTALRVTHGMESQQSNSDHETRLILGAFAADQNETRKSLEKKTQLHAKKISRILAILIQKQKIEQVGKGAGAAYRILKNRNCL